MDSIREAETFLRLINMRQARGDDLGTPSRTEKIVGKEGVT